MPDATILIRKAKLGDLDILNGFQQDLIVHERRLTPTIKEGDAEYYSLKGLIANPDANVLVGVDNDTIISSGYMLIKKSEPYERPEWHGHLGFLYVLPAYRGKGIIKPLVQQLIRWANERDIYEIRLEVYSKNENAIQAYTKLGFVPDQLRMLLDTKSNRMPS